jgi:SAM-dependent methyltransferase
MTRTLLPLLILLWTPLALALDGGTAEVRDATAPPQISQATLDRIQRECLRAYPKELLAPMASGAEAIPAQVEADPKGQVQFLDKELTLDKGLFYPALLEDLLPPFERYLRPGLRFLDLGSGDGRVLFLAAGLGVAATGIEYDPVLIAVHHRASKALEDVVDTTRIEVIQGDFFKQSWAPYDVIYYFDQSSFDGKRVRKKLRRELKPGAILLVYYEQAPFPKLEVVERLKTLTVYRQPVRQP